MTPPAPAPVPGTGDVWSVEGYERNAGMRYRVLEHRKAETLILATGFKTEEAAIRWLGEWSARAIIGPKERT